MKKDLKYFTAAIIQDTLAEMRDSKENFYFQNRPKYNEIKSHVKQKNLGKCPQILFISALKSPKVGLYKDVVG